MARKRHTPEQIINRLREAEVALPKTTQDWSLRSLQVKLIKIGGRLVRPAQRLMFKLVEGIVPWELVAAILGRISRLKLATG